MIDKLGFEAVVAIALGINFHLALLADVALATAAVAAIANAVASWVMLGIIQVFIQFRI